MAFFFRRGITTDHNPNDRIFPLHYFEKTHLVQGVNVAIALFVDEVLDPQFLKRSLENLVKRKGWERLGGRVRKNASGEIEWHIPSEFTDDRPAITFVHFDHDMPAASHPSASQIPQPSERPTIVCNPGALRDLVWDPSYNPTGINEYLTSDNPVLGLRVVSFTDKTVVVFQWQHMAFDTLGMQYLLSEWSKVIAGREDEVLTPVSYESDPFDALAKGTRPITEKHILADHHLGFGGVLRWGLGYGIDTFVRAKEDRILCVPESYWRSELEIALAELREKAITEGKDPSKIFLTEGDIITALIWRCSVLSMRMDHNRLVVGSIAMSLRKAFEGDLLPESSVHPYVGNAWGWGNVLATMGDIASKPLSWLAREIRQAINDQGTKAQHEAYYAMLRESNTVMPINIFGNSTMCQFGLSNWTKARLFDIDFSPARKTPKEGNLPCTPSYVQEHHGPIVPPDGFYVLGKDGQGNYWISGTKLSGQWDNFGDQLNKYFEGKTY